MRGDYERWVRTHARELFAMAYRLSGHRQIAEDLVQETFAEAWRCREQLAEPLKARGWLFSILRHRWSHHLRDASRRPTLVGSAEHEDRTAAPMRSPLETLEHRDTLQRALNSLDEKFRLPLLMVLMEGKTSQQVADALEIPLGTVLSRLHRARAALRASPMNDPIDSPAAQE